MANLLLIKSQLDSCCSPDRVFEKQDLTPLFIPVGNVIPETMTQAIARILHQSGSIDKNAYDRINGVTFDGDYEDGSEPDFDPEEFDNDYDEWQQSKFASYEDDKWFSQGDRVSEKRVEKTTVPNAEGNSSGSDKGLSTPNQNSQGTAKDSSVETGHTGETTIAGDA